MAQTISLRLEVDNEVGSTMDGAPVQCEGTISMAELARPRQLKLDRRLQLTESMYCRDKSVPSLLSVDKPMRACADKFSYHLVLPVGQCSDPQDMAMSSLINL